MDMNLYLTQIILIKITHSRELWFNARLMSLWLNALKKYFDFFKYIFVCVCVCVCVCVYRYIDCLIVCIKIALDKEIRYRFDNISLLKSNNIIFINKHCFCNWLLFYYNSIMIKAKYALDKEIKCKLNNVKYTYIKRIKAC